MRCCAFSATSPTDPGRRALSSSRAALQRLLRVYPESGLVSDADAALRALDAPALAR